jgi:hypothetical protein
MGETAESWRVSEVLPDSQRKQRVVDWEQANAPHLTLSQCQVLTKLAICVRDFEVERRLDGDCSLEELSQDAQRWVEFIKDHEVIKKRYDRVMAMAVRHGLLANPQYCRRYYRGRHGKVRMRFGVLDEAHPLVSEWVRQRRAVGDTGLHRFWPTTHAALDHGVPQVLFGHEGEADLAEKVAECRHKGKSWRAIYRMLQGKDQLLQDKKEVVRHNSAEALRKWAIAHALEEAPPAGMPRREWGDIQQREAQERQQMGETIEKCRTREVTPQPSGGYIARVHTASGDQVEVEGRDRIGALLQLSQSLWHRFPGEAPQQVSDT